MRRQPDSRLLQIVLVVEDAEAGGHDQRCSGGQKDDRRVRSEPRVVEGVAPKDLKSLVDESKAKIGSGVVVLVTASDGKASLVVGVTDDLTARINAVDLARLGAEALGGKGGGGRPDMAQAGGPDGSRAAEALSRIEQRLAALEPAA